MIKIHDADFGQETGGGFSCCQATWKPQVMLPARYCALPLAPEIHTCRNSHTGTRSTGLTSTTFHELRAPSLHWATPWKRVPGIQAGFLHF